MTPIHTSVIWAFRHSGFLNAGTPLEIASTPVTAAPPEANALSTTKTVTAAAPIGTPPLASCAATENGWRCPVTTW
jgi:hypothetical protein